MPMKSYEYLDLTSKLPNIDAFPVLWIEWALDWDNERALKDFFVIFEFLWYGGIVGMVLGALFFIIGIFVVLYFFTFFRTPLRASSSV